MSSDTLVLYQKDSSSTLRDVSLDSFYMYIRPFATFPYSTNRCSGHTSDSRTHSFTVASFFFPLSPVASSASSA